MRDRDVPGMSIYAHGFRRLSCRRHGKIESRAQGNNGRIVRPLRRNIEESGTGTKTPRPSMRKAGAMSIM